VSGIVSANYSSDQDSSSSSEDDVSIGRRSKHVSDAAGKHPAFSLNDSMLNYPQ